MHHTRLNRKCAYRGCRGPGNVILHTFASLLLQQGESSHYVKEQMGHASIQTTVDVYGHLVPGSNRNAVNKLDDDASQNLKIVPAAG